MAAAAGTWAFSLPAVERMRQGLLRGGFATDCLQGAMADVENDEETGVFVVGRGGYPNKDGIIQCDAAIMEGHPGRFGAVAAMHGIGTPLAVARKVMEASPHSFLAGEGAVAFAKDQNFTVEDNRSLMSKRGSEAYQEFSETKKSVQEHDTLGLIALDVYGNITVGVSTSGAPFKYPGRVGDSPLPGCGLFADKEVGAAAATGDGDKIMCFCPCFHTVLLMRQGLSPMDACQAVVQDILQRTGKEKMFELGIIAMNMKVALEPRHKTNQLEWPSDTRTCGGPVGNPRMRLNFVSATWKTSFGDSRSNKIKTTNVQLRLEAALEACRVLRNVAFCSVPE